VPVEGGAAVDEAQAMANIKANAEAQSTPLWRTTGR
jgi:hypothetical protein